MITRVLAAIWAILDAVIGRAPASRDLADEAKALRLVAGARVSTRPLERKPGETMRAACERDREEGEAATRIPQWRLVAAFLRLLQSGAVVRVDGSYYLTERGWEDIGRPLTANDLHMLRWMRDEPDGRHDSVMWRAVTTADVDRWRERRFLPAEGWGITIAGLAACRGGEAMPSRLGTVPCSRCRQRIKADSAGVHAKLCVAGEMSAISCPDCGAVIWSLEDHRGGCDWWRREVRAGRSGIPSKAAPS